MIQRLSEERKCPRFQQMLSPVMNYRADEYVQNYAHVSIKVPETEGGYEPRKRMVGRKANFNAKHLVSGTRTSQEINRSCKSATLSDTA